MNRAIIITKLIFIFCIAGLPTSGQQRYTPYDDLPGMIKSHKPAYYYHFPSWAKMLYDYPVNYYEVVGNWEKSATDQGENHDAVTRYFKLWRRNVEPFVREDGAIQLPDLDQYYRDQKALQLAASKNEEKNIKSRSGWSFLGPKETFWLNESGSSQTPKSCPWQVNVYSFDVSASDNNILYCGTETGFVNKTSDQGITWQLVAPGYYFGGAVTATVIHPTNPDIVYMAAGNQVYKTADGGISWIPLLETDALFYANRMKIDLSNPDKILAAADNGVYIRTNGGLSWEKSWDLQSYDVEIKPNNPNTIFALTAMSGKFSIIISTDGGVSFSPDTSFPSDIADASGGLLAVTPASPDFLLVLMLSSDNTPYLYKRTFGIGNWILAAAGQTSVFPMNNGQGYFDLVLEISPVNQNLIFAGTTTLYKTTNGGQNFTAIGGYSGAFSIHPDIQDMKLLPNGNTWVATDGGMTLTTDNFSGTNNYYSRNNGLIGSDMWGFDQGWNEDVVVGGRYHNGNTALADFYQPKALRMGGAESPTGWVLQGKSRHVAFDDLGNGWILPQTAEGHPEGRFIFSKFPNMDEYGGRRGNMVFHPNYYGIIYLGEGNGFWKSTDMGVTWDLLNDFGQRVRYLQISFSNPEVLYADVVNKGLYKSEDGGQTWMLKPSLTGGQYGTSYWKGKTFISVSPWNENVIYACLQNGTWSADLGKIFRSSDGGDTWEDWSGSLSEYTKCMAIQPTAEGQELVYLFTNAMSGHPAKVYFRSTGMNDWEVYADDYPAGMHVNMALPFFRDSKLRSAGNAGVWESDLVEPEFFPVINPWVEKPFYDCIADTVFLDDHSILNHEGASWLWTITPAPEYISDANIRNPKVVLGNPGTYDVSLTVTKAGVSYIKSISAMITATTCPSIEDCNNPAQLPKDIWQLLYVDSQETGYPGLATMSFDNDPATIWHTRWSNGTDPYPHEIQIDLGETYKLYKFTLLNRQDGENGRIKAYELYMSENPLVWGTPVSNGEFENTAAPQTIVFDEAIFGRYFRLKALSEVNGNEWASVAEFSFVGCTDLTFGTNEKTAGNLLNAFPVPTSGLITVPLPEAQSFSYAIFSSSGQQLMQGKIENPEDIFSLDLSEHVSGVYFISLMDESGRVFRVKVLKE